jgi:hypothetical protein
VPRLASPGRVACLTDPEPTRLRLAWARQRGSGASEMGSTATLTSLAKGKGREGRAAQGKGDGDGDGDGRARKGAGQGRGTTRETPQRRPSISFGRLYGYKPHATRVSAPPPISPPRRSPSDPNRLSDATLQGLCVLRARANALMPRSNPEWWSAPATPASTTCPASETL